MPNRVITVVIRGNVTGLQTAAAQGSAALQGMARSASTAAQTQSQALRTVGDTAGKIGLVASAGLGAAIAAAANFDQAMSNVQAATHESAANMEALRAAALKAGADTAFSASEAAGGIENLAKAGVGTRDILNGGLSGALDLAAAGSIDVADAAETAATAMTQFGLSGQDVPHIADLLAAAAGKAQGEVGDFAQALNQSGLVANQVGLSIEETTGALGAFASAGLLGSDAGTSFKTMLLRLNPSTKEAKQLMEQVGLSAYDAQGNFVGLTEYAARLHDSLDGMSAAQRTAALQTIFGSDAIRAANIIYEQGGRGIQKWIDKVDDQGYAAETAATKLDNLRGDLEAFGGSLETALIGVGEGSQGPLRGVVQQATDVVNAFNELPDAAHGVVAGILAITAVTGVGVFFGARTIRAIADTRTALTELGVTAQITSQRLAAISKVGVAAALGAGLVQLADQMDDVQLSARQMNGALDVLAQGNVAGNLEHLGFGVDNLGEALRDAAFGDFNLFGLGQADEIEALDHALADFADNSPRKAAAAFQTIREQAAAAGVGFEDLARLFPEYAAQLAEAGRTLEGGFQDDLPRFFDSTTKALLQAATGNGEFADSAQAAAAAVQKQTDAMRDARSEAIRAANAEIDYQASIDDARAALHDNGRTLDITTEKGRANKTALLGMASAWNNQSEAVKNAKGAYRGAVNQFVATATAMGLGEAAARRLAKRLYEVPNRVKTDVDVDTRSADSKLDVSTTKARILDAIHAIPKVDADTVGGMRSLAAVSRELGVLDRTTARPSVAVQTGNALAQVDAVRRSILALNGDTATTYVRTVKIGGGGRDVVGGLATGGPVIGPGTATSDSIPAYLSNGEYVARAAAVNYYGREFFDRVNALQYARGGSVGYAAPTSVAAPTAAPGGGRSITINGDLVAADPRALVRQIEQRERDAMALIGAP